MNINTGKVQNLNDNLKKISAFTKLNSFEISYSSILKLQTNRFRKFSLDHTLIIPEKNFLFTWIPKCGCSTLKRTLFNNKKENQGKLFHTLDKMSRRQKINFLAKNQSIKKFALCRSPEKRVLSCFLEKFIDFKFHQLQHLTNYLGLYSLDISQIKFLDFLKALDYKSNLILDSHWIPQNLFFLFEESKYDEIFLLENISSLKIFLSKMNIEFIDDREYKSPDGITEMHSTSLLLTDDSLEGRDMSIVDLLKAKFENKKPSDSSFWGDEEINLFKKLYKKDLFLSNKIMVPRGF